jgi:hypothetical protein
MSEYRKVGRKWLPKSQVKPELNKILIILINEKGKDSEVYGDNLNKLPTNDLKERADELSNDLDNPEDFYNDDLFNSHYMEFLEGNATGTKRKSTKRKSTKRKSTKRKSTKRKSTKRKSTKRKSTKRKSTKRRTIKKSRRMRR